MISESNDLPQLYCSEEVFNPYHYLTESQEDNSIPAIVIYFSTSLPIQAYSEENIELLKTLASCSNQRIFENLLIQKIIDYNWDSVMNWICFYSLIALLNLIFFIFCITYGRTNPIYLVPFALLFGFIFLWEILQVYSLGSEYFRESINYRDILMLIFVIYWAVLRKYFALRKL